MNAAVMDPVVVEGMPDQRVLVALHAHKQTQFSELNSQHMKTDQDDC